MISETEARNANTIIIDLDIGSRIVTFKLRRDVIKKLDNYVKVHGLGTRSSVLRKLSEAFVKALEEVGNGATINSITVRVSFKDSSGCEKTVDVVLTR